MSIIDVIRRSARSLKSAKGRTILTALAIAVGGFTLTVTMAAGNGISHYTDNLIASNLDPAELIVARDKDALSFGGGDGKPKEFEENVASISFGGDGSTIQFKQVTDKDVSELRSLPFAGQVRESYTLNIRYISREGQKKYTASALAYNPAQKPELVAGEVPKSGDLQPGEIILPEDYKSILGFSSAEDMIGKQVSVNVRKTFSIESVLSALQSQSLDADATQPVDKSMTLKIVGVNKKPTTTLQPGPLPMLFGSKDAREIYDYEYKNTSDYGKYLAVLVHVNDGNDDAKLQAAKTNLESKGYFVKTSKDLQASLNQIVQIFTVLVGVFGAITVVASVFGIVNTQYISVLERTREIGLMKSLGMRRRDVRRLFMLEAGWIGLIGGILGIAGGLTLGLLLNPVIDRKWGLHFIFDPVQIVTLEIALISVAVFAGFLPARKAAKLDPIEALRTE